MPILFLTIDFGDDRIPRIGDFGVVGDAVLHDFGGSQRVAAVDQRNLGGEFGEKRRLLDGRIAAADDGDLFSLDKSDRRTWRTC